MFIGKEVCMQENGPKSWQWLIDEANALRRRYLGKPPMEIAGHSSFSDNLHPEQKRLENETTP